MEFQRKVNDIETVFNQNWNANHNYQELKKMRENRQQHFNHLHGIKDKEERKKEILAANSIEGRVKRLEENMRASQGNELLRNRNNFR